MVKTEDTLQLGQFKISFFHINHNIPDSVGIVIETPAGVICHTGDWKFDFHPAGTKHADFQTIAAIGKKGVMCLMGDSTNANTPGHQLSEKVINEELGSIIEKAPGRVIIGTFASLLSRVKQILEISEKLGKKVAQILDRHVKGEKLHRIPVQKVIEPTIMLNRTTAKYLNVRVPSTLRERISFVD